jgi:hypothetical protein
MAKLRITTESLPRRCEICHQSDRFDAFNNYCSRCTDLLLEPALNGVIVNSYGSVNEASARIFLSLGTSIGGLSKLIPWLYSELTKDCLGYCPLIRFPDFEMIFTVTIFMMIGATVGMLLKMILDCSVYK